MNSRSALLFRGELRKAFDIVSSVKGSIGPTTLVDGDSPAFHDALTCATGALDDAVIILTRAIDASEEAERIRRAQVNESLSLPHHSQ